MVVSYKINLPLLLICYTKKLLGLRAAMKVFVNVRCSGKAGSKGRPRQDGSETRSIRLAGHASIITTTGHLLRSPLTITQTDVLYHRLQRLPGFDFSLGEDNHLGKFFKKVSRLTASAVWPSLNNQARLRAHFLFLFINYNASSAHHLSWLL